VLSLLWTIKYQTYVVFQCPMRKSRCLANRCGFAQKLVQMKRSTSNFRGTTTMIPAVFVRRVSGLEILSKLQAAEEKGDTLYATLCAGEYRPNSRFPFVDIRTTGIAPLIKVQSSASTVLHVTPPHWPPADSLRQELQKLGLRTELQDIIEDVSCHDISAQNLSYRSLVSSVEHCVISAPSTASADNSS